VITGGLSTREGHALLLLDVTPLSLGLELWDGTLLKLIERNTPIPCSNKVLLTNKHDAGIASSQLSEGEEKEHKKLPPTPGLLGEMVGAPIYKVFSGVRDHILGERSMLDADRNQPELFPSVEKGEIVPPQKKTAMSLKSKKKTMSLAALVYQGESLVAQNNRLLANFEVVIPAEKAGGAKVSMEFDLDVNGTLTVRAVDKKTMEEFVVRIENSGNLDTATIERMKKEADEFELRRKKNKD
jgi:molecular chaperone DnaK (HSP70)